MPGNQKERSFRDGDSEIPGFCWLPIFLFPLVWLQVLRIVDSEDGDNPVVAVEDSVALAA